LLRARICCHTNYVRPLLPLHSNSVTANALREIYKRISFFFFFQVQGSKSRFHYLAIFYPERRFDNE
jgi:hypothetical protein